MRRWKLNLMMFEGGAGAAPAGAAEGTGATAQAAAVQQAENRLANGQAEDRPASGEDLNAEFDALINGKYKDIYNSRMQNITKERLKSEKSKSEKERAEWKAKEEKTNEFLNLIGSKYGIMDGNLENIQKAVMDDSSYWEDAAAREGMSVSQYQHMKQMERENARWRAMHEDTIKQRQKEQLHAKWEREAEELGKLYPGFDLQKESQNPDFARLLGVGIDMRTTYETLHHDEIMSGAMTYAAQKVAERQVNAIKNGQSHPAEGASQSSPSVKTAKDISKLTLKEMKELARRAGNGERITLREE